MEKIRHYQRYTVMGSGFIYYAPIQNVAFSINDISASGINITIEVDLEKDEVITMDLQVSGSIFPYSKLLKGKVIRKSKYNAVYNYGIQFMDLPIKDIIEIDEYLRLNYSSIAPYRTFHDSSDDDNPFLLLHR